MGDARDPSGIDFPTRAIPPQGLRVAAVLGLVALCAVGLLALRLAAGPPPVGSPGTSVATPELGLASVGPLSLDVATWVPFRSARNGISARFPPGWLVTPALGASYYTRQGFAAPAIDQLHDPGPTDGAMDSAISTGGMALFISSLRVPAGVNDVAWWTEYAGADVCAGCTPGHLRGASAACFPAVPSAYRPVTVDGQPGYEHGGLASCAFFTEVVGLVGGRAYQLTAIPDVNHATSGIFDPALFEAWLSTIHFDPASADDTPPASPSPR